MIIVQGEVYLEQEHVRILKNEEEYVKKRYHAVARTLAEDVNQDTKDAGREDHREEQAPAPEDSQALQG